MPATRKPKAKHITLKPRAVRLYPLDVALLGGAGAPSPASETRDGARVPPETVLEEAARITGGARHASYGEPLDNHQCTADMATAFFRRKYGAGFPALSAEDVCMFNIVQKCAREANTPKRDNLVDMAGYARNMERCGDERTARNQKIAV